MAGRWTELLTGRYGTYTLVLNLGVTLFGINQFVVATVMPTVIADLGGVSYYTWAFSLFSVGAIMGAAGAGPLRAALGARRAYVNAGLILAIGLVISATATGMPALVAGRLLQGIGGGAIAAMAYALVASVFPEHLRSRELMIVSSIWGIATVGGPGVGAAFAAPGLWRGAFWSLAACSVVFSVLAWRFVEDERSHGRLSRLPFARLGLLALAVLLMSMTSLTQSMPLQALLTLASIAAAAEAFRRDARALDNIFPRRITAITAELGATYWIFFLVSVVLAFINTYTTFYLQKLHGIGPLVAGYLFCLQSLMWTVSAIWVAELRAALLPPAVLAGVALVLGASVVIAVTVDMGPVWLIALALVVSGTGMGILNNPAIQHIMAVATPKERGIAGASVQAIRNIGISFGAAASGMVAAAAGLTDTAPRETIAHAMQWVFSANVLFGLAALAISIRMAKRRRPSDPGP